MLIKSLPMKMYPFILKCPRNKGYTEVTNGQFTKSVDSDSLIYIYSQIQ